MDSFTQKSSEASPPEEAIAPAEIIKSPDDLLKKIGLDPSAIGFSGKLESLAETESRLRREEAELIARLDKEKAERDARIDKEKLDDSHLKG